MATPVRPVYCNAVVFQPEEHPGIAWYAIRTKPRFEKKVALGLRGKGYEEFLPLHQVRRAKSDRVVVVDHPLFPGYLFCRFDCTKRLPVLTTPGVIYIVSSREQLSSVSDEEIISLQKVMQSGLSIQESPYLIGTKVRIVTGPLAGVHGTVTRIKDMDRVVVSVAILQRSVAVEVVAESLAAQDREYLP
jgi:transcription antitermination factor NusG